MSVPSQGPGSWFPDGEPSQEKVFGPAEGTVSQGIPGRSFLRMGWGSEFQPKGLDSLGEQWPVQPGGSLLTNIYQSF